MARASQRRTTKSRKHVTVVEVDFTGVESGGRAISNGWAHGRVKKAEWTEAKESGNQMVKVSWEAKRGKEKATVYDNLVNTENALWRFKQMLEAVGIEVPDGALDVDVSELVDLECDLLIENEEYEGKDQPRIVDYRPAGAAEIDEEIEAKPKRRSKDKDEEEEEEEPVKRKRSRDEEEEEEEETPRKKKRTRVEQEDEDEEEDRPVRKGSKRKVEEEDENEIREGSKVKFKDEDDKLTRGTVKEIDGDDVEVETTKGDVYEVKIGELELA